MEHEFPIETAALWAILKGIEDAAVAGDTDTVKHLSSAAESILSGLPVETPR